MADSLADLVVRRHRKRFVKKVKWITKEEAEPLMDKARWASYYSGNTEHYYGEFRYESESWDNAERR